MADEAEPQMLKRPIFVASLGNPPQRYADTFHSAGHTLLDSVRSSFGYPEWKRDKLYANGFISRGSAYTFWQSPALMNVSGSPVLMKYEQEQSS